MKIPGFSKYDAMAFGQIMRDGKTLKTYPSQGGYPTVSITNDDGKRKHMMVHSLVARTFLGPRPNGCGVNHKNGLKFDNRVENLEWVTHAENLQHAHRNGLIRYDVGHKPHLQKLSKFDADKIRLLHSKGVRIVKLVDLFNVHRATIHRIISWRAHA